ncbi:hypothetical protein ABIV58_004774 [Escherichia coli]
MTTQITIRNKQADNLLIYIEKYKAKFEERLVAYNAVGQLEWNAGSWRFGEKGVAWLKESGKRIKWLILPLHESETDRHLIGLSG